MAYLRDGTWIVTQPGSALFSTATMVATMYLGADRKWKYILPQDGQPEYVPDNDNSPTAPGANVLET